MVDPSMALVFVEYFGHMLTGFLPVSVEVLSRGLCDVLYG